MKKISKKFVLKNKEFIISEMKEGKIFIYPTDTVYGLGCDATNLDSVDQIYDIKRRESKPLLIIAPSKEWIYENCSFFENHENLIKTKLPGQYSFIVGLKNRELVSLNLMGTLKTLGVRIPDCFFSDIVNEFGLPFITTSVNFSGETPAIKANEINQEILDNIDYLIEDDKELSGSSSRIMDITKKEIKIIRR